MSTQTTNYGLEKPDANDFYDVSVMNDNLDIIDTTLKSKADQTEVDSLKKSVSDGKSTVANAITGQGVTTATDATFATMATNIGTVATNKYNAGVSATKKGTATAAQVLSGYTFTNTSTVGASGTMVNNGAVSQSLGINGSYTIPAGYHNGSGKITQSITTKAAATYTPGDSAQTIASGQYLSGVQTISAVPTETKSVTAGTSATTVSRTSGKYMTSVTVNPTPSQTKSVTLTTSPLTITPDSGKLLSSVTVTANINRRYASGTNWSRWEWGRSWNILVPLKEDREYPSADYCVVKILTGINWTPAFYKVIITYKSGASYYTTCKNGDTSLYWKCITVDDVYSDFIACGSYQQYVNGNELYLAVRDSAWSVESASWEAWE